MILWSPRRAILSYFFKVSLNRASNHLFYDSVVYGFGTLSLRVFSLLYYGQLQEMLSPRSMGGLHSLSEELIV
jgi:hypothetical protein